MTDPTQLPTDLPAPEDDGAARHLPGLAMPLIALATTTGATVQPRRARRRPHRALPLPDDRPPRRGPARRLGHDPRRARLHARGLRLPRSPRRPARRRRRRGLRASSQSTDEQAEAATRLHLPFPLLSDPDLQLADQLRLPTFEADGQTRYRRLTLVITAGTIEHAFYPIFPPDAHAGEVLRWLRGQRCDELSDPDLMQQIRQSEAAAAEGDVVSPNDLRERLGSDPEHDR